MTINKILLSAVTAIALTGAVSVNAASHAAPNLTPSFDVAEVGDVVGLTVESIGGTMVGPVVMMIERRGEPHLIIDISKMRAADVFTVAMPISDFDLENGNLTINADALVFLENEPHFDPSALTPLDEGAQVID